jgi:hypothetical protein
MALPRRLQIKLEQKIRQESEAALNRWLVIGFLALGTIEVGSHLFR